MQRMLLLAAGMVSLSLGILGIVVPLLPTTPFLLLASVCFLRSSRRLHGWLTKHPVLGTYILAYQRFHAVSGRAKAVSLFFLWVCILSSSVFFVTNWWFRIALLAIATGVTIHIRNLKTLTKEMSEMLRQESAFAPY